VSDADADANRGGRMSPPGENSENRTNEAKLDDDVVIIQNKGRVGVAANSGVDPGLDKREVQPRRAKGKEQGLNRESHISARRTDDRGLRTKECHWHEIEPLPDTALVR
jgi:hypothetical protein